MQEQIELKIRAYAGSRGFKAAILSRWLEQPEKDAAALLELASSLRLGENQLLGLWNWSDEIARRDGTGAGEILSSDGIREVLQSSLGRNDKLERIRGVLRRRRYPELTRAEEQIAELVRQLDLPREIRVTWPPFLEGEELRIEIVARDPSAVKRAAAALVAAAESLELKEIFDLF